MLGKAMAAKDDEFYTRYETVEAELKHYWPQLKGKRVYLNCDDPRISNFWRYLYDNYHAIGLESLTATYYGDSAEIWQYDGHSLLTDKLYGDGSYDSDECLEQLNNCDVVITNPPFSLFGDFIDTMIDSGKDFLVIGSSLATGYQNIFDRIMSGDIKIGFSSSGARFDRPDGSVKAVNIAWFTTLDVDNQKPFIPLTKTFNTDDYPTYDNYDAINCDKVADIPLDYDGLIGVPITYLLKHNPAQFDILGISEAKDRYGLKTRNYKDMYQVIDGLELRKGGSNKCACLLYLGSKKNNSAALVFRRGMDNNKAALPFNPKGNKKPYLDKTDGREVLLQMMFHRVFIKRKQAANDSGFFMGKDYDNQLCRV